MAQYSINNLVGMPLKSESVLIVVRASPLLLAVATCSSQQSIHYTLLEPKDCFVSPRKKKPYDRPHLRLTKQYCQILPYTKSLSTCSKYVPRKDSKRWHARVTNTVVDDTAKLLLDSNPITQSNTNDSISIPSKSESTVIVVGAGPSGLATAACLTQHSIPYILLEREDCFAPLWKKKTYDRLHLHLPKEVCQLPFMNFPSSFPKYVPKKDFLQYLDNYVAHFHINPLFRRRVVGASFDQESKRWNVRVVNTEGGGEEEYIGRFLVVATGETSDPYCPQIEGLSSFQGEVTHSTQYKSGKEYEGKRVLVVGAGNSGMEIALDLANYGAKPSIVVRSPVHILSREMVNIGVFLGMYLPLNVVDSFIVLLSKLTYRGFSKYGLSRPHQGPFYLKTAFGKFPIIDVGTYRKIESGEIKVLPGITSIRGNDVFFEDGSSYIFDAIIFATGFKRSTHEWLQGGEDLLNEDGLSKKSFPNHWKGQNGLYCVGLAKRGLFGSGFDAQNVALDIKSRLQIAI